MGGSLGHEKRHMAQGQTDGRGSMNNRYLLRRYWNGDRSLPCRVAYSEYARDYYHGMTRGRSNLVPIKRARQMLLTFESAHDAARALRMSQPTLWRIMHGKVKKIRIEAVTKQGLLFATA